MFVFTTLILNAIYAFCVAKPHNSNSDTTSTSNLTLRSTTPTAPPSSTQTVTALLFYTLTTPTTSIFHLTLTLLTHHTNPQHLRTKLAYTLLIPTTTLLAAGWLTTVSIWTHCEIPPLNRHGQQICPPQVRGHFMYGIHEVSIAKTAITWIIFVLYAVDLLILVGGNKAQRRVWRITVKTGPDFDHGDATEIVVRV